MFENIDFTASTDIIVPLSSVANGTILRDYVVTGIPTDLLQKEIRLQGIVKHYTLDENNQKVPSTEFRDDFYTMLADEHTRVDRNGNLTTNGEIGEYTWISRVLETKTLSYKEVAIIAIQRQDRLGLIKPR